MEFTLSNQQLFPIGTTVKAYPQSNWRRSQIPPEGAPKGASTAEGVVGAGGSVTLSGLTAGTYYYAAAEVGGQWRYVLFVPIAPTGSGSAEEVAAEKARAEGAEAAIKGEVATEKAGREAAITAAVGAEEARAKAAENARLVAANNLSDLANAGTARGNLGLGTAATMAAGAAGEAGKVLKADDASTTNTRTPTNGSVTAAKIGDLAQGTRHYIKGVVGPEGSTQPGAKVMRWAPVYIPQPCKLTGIVYEVGEVSNGKVIVALYNSAGERKAVSTATAQSAAGQVQRVPFEAQFEVPEAGVYYVALLMESATGTFRGVKSLDPWKEAAEAAVAAPAAVAVPAEINNSGNKLPMMGTY
jgi:hypothetical protein